MLIKTEDLTFDFSWLMHKKKLKNIAELAYKTNVPYSEMERLVNNTGHVISDIHIKSLCDFFECESIDFLSNKTKKEVRKESLYKYEKKFSNRKGIVYFAKSTGGEYDGLTKIGFTQDLNQRLKSLKTKTKSKINLLHYIPTNDAFGTEKLLHTIFRNQKVKGEWFSLTEKELSLVKEEENEKQTG